MEIKTRARPCNLLYFPTKTWKNAERIINNTIWKEKRKMRRVTGSISLSINSAQEPTRMTVSSRYFTDHVVMIFYCSTIIRKVLYTCRYCFKNSLILKDIRHKKFPCSYAFLTSGNISDPKASFTRGNLESTS